MADKDVHPIKVEPADTTLLERVRELEYAVSILWDQVWWMNLTAEKRAEYAQEGYSDPIKRFYVPLHDVHRKG